MSYHDEPYFIIDKATGEIVNAVTGCRTAAEAAEIFGDGFEAKRSGQIPRDTLERYPFWNERP